MPNFRTENTPGVAPADLAELNSAHRALLDGGPAVLCDADGEIVAVADLLIANWTPGAPAEELVLRVREDLGLVPRRPAVQVQAGPAVSVDPVPQAEHGWRARVAALFGAGPRTPLNPV